MTKNRDLWLEIRQTRRETGPYFRKMDGKWGGGSYPQIETVPPKIETSALKLANNTHGILNKRPQIELKSKKGPRRK